MASTRVIFGQPSPLAFNPVSPPPAEMEAPQPSTSSPAAISAPREPYAIAGWLVEYRPPPTESLPRGWSSTHDHVICYCDTSGLEAPDIIKSLRKFDIHLSGTITAAQIEKRLRQLDQIPEIDYWRKPFGRSATGTAKAEAIWAAGTNQERNGLSLRRSRESLTAGPAAPRPRASTGNLWRMMEEAEEAQASAATAITTNERVENY